MANATISGFQLTKNGNFNLMVAFMTPVTGFDDTNVTLTTVSGNGITGITFEVMGCGADYNITFQLPQNVEGEIQVTISGMVTVKDGSNPEVVIATPVTVAYNTITSET